MRNWSTTLHLHQLCVASSVGELADVEREDLCLSKKSCLLNFCSEGTLHITASVSVRHVEMAKKICQPTADNCSSYLCQVKREAQTISGLWIRIQVNGCRMASIKTSMTMLNIAQHISTHVGVTPGSWPTSQMFFTVGPRATLKYLGSSSRAHLLRKAVTERVWAFVWDLSEVSLRSQGCDILKAFSLEAIVPDKSVTSKSSYVCTKRNCDNVLTCPKYKNMDEDDEDIFVFSHDFLQPSV